MTNIWGLAYASVWYDVFGHRIPLRFHRDGVWSGPALTSLALVPTSIMVLGFFVALREAVRRRGRSDDAPLVAMWCAGFASFASFTWWAPSAVAVKASYLLSLAVPGAVFFARGVMLLHGWPRAAVLLVSVAVVAMAAAIFTNGLVFPPYPDGFMVGRWRFAGVLIPDGYIVEAVDRLVGSR